MKKKTGRMWIGAITVALIALIAVWTELSGTERLETNSPGYQAGVAAYEEGDYATAIEKLQPFAEPRTGWGTVPPWLDVLLWTRRG